MSPDTAKEILCSLSDSGISPGDSEDGNILCSAAVKITGISDGDMRSRSRASTEIGWKSGQIQFHGGICTFNSYLQDVGLDTLDHSTQLVLLFTLLIFGRCRSWRRVRKLKRINIRDTEHFDMRTV